MSSVAIRVQGLSKKYTLGAVQDTKYRTLAETITDTLMSPYRRLRWLVDAKARSPKPVDEILWALRDVDLEIDRGDVVGLIGRNGAGKSTLLKILSRITEPTSGYAEIYGAVGSLLEVGTGFHQELTGRENVYLNGSILGMRHAEIERKLDEIVAFAEVEKFLDTPVKHYSSGMYLRLAFSVAAHLEPEILLVDEVLAVGDLTFQKKCLGKMDDVASQGRTVLFVSHNLGAIKDLCRTSIVMHRGQVVFRGPVVQGVAKYTSSLLDDPDEHGNPNTGWSSVRVNGQIGGAFTTVQPGEPFDVEATLTIFTECARAKLFMIIEDSAGNTIVHRRITNEEIWGDAIRPGRYRVKVELPPLWMAPGVCTAYFKLVGHSAKSDVKRLSERVTLDVPGNPVGNGDAYLAPSVRWVVSDVGDLPDLEEEPVGEPSRI